MTESEIRKHIEALKDERFAAFQRRLLPTVPPEKIVGVKTPELKKLAKQVIAEGDEGFLAALPHELFEEDQLHAFIICEEREFDRAIQKTEIFLPHIDNWATCDQLLPKAFTKCADKLKPYIDKWMHTDGTYIARFGIGMAMKFFLGERFYVSLLDDVAGIACGDYYLDMMKAWFFAEALVKRYEETLPYIENNVLCGFVRRKTIQKAVESFRVPPERKEYLLSIK